MFDNLKRAHQRFKEEGFSDPFVETLKLFDIIYKSRLQKMNLDPLDKDGINLDQVIEGRKKGIPIEYILSRANFMDRTFICTKDTLIPTPETSVLVDAVCDMIKERKKVKKDQTIIDIGTGCGNIAISIALNTDDTTIYASDISPNACTIAKNNVDKYGLMERVKVVCGDLFEPFQEDFKEKVDVIVCNPPYLPTESINKLPSEIKDHEPWLALDAGPFGLDFFIRLIKDAHTILEPDGVLLFEFGEGQNKMIERLIKNNGGYNIINFLNYENISRMIIVQKIKMIS